MIDITPPNEHSGDQYPFLDTLLRDALPEIKLALGELIDRENARSLPSKYARILPETLLVVTVRPDAAEALAPVAATVEAELSDSCSRHGSLYDRVYRVQLRRSDDPNAPLYRVTAHGGHAPEGAIEAPPSAPSAPSAPAGPSGLDEAAPADASAGRSGPHADLPAVRADREGATEAHPLPLSDPDATRIGDAGPPGWEPGRWLLVVEDDQGEQQEVFRLTDPYNTVGRRSDDPQLQTTVALRDVPHVSRRQLALVWEERDGAPGFRVYNVGLNPVHLPGQEVPGAHVGKGALQLERVAERHTGWLPPGVPMRIGEQGPTLRIEEVPEEAEQGSAEAPVPEDPDATRFE